MPEEKMPEISEEERTTMIEDFELTGAATFTIGVDGARYEALVKYCADFKVFTYTDIDREGGTITLTKRPLGSLELG